MKDRQKDKVAQLTTGSLSRQAPRNVFLRTKLNGHDVPGGETALEARKPLSSANNEELTPHHQRRAILEELAHQAYHHPLSRVTSVDGKLPFVDMADSPNGNRYLIQEFTRVDGNGDVQRTSGVIEVPLLTELSRSSPQVSPPSRRRNGSCGCAEAKNTSTARRAAAPSDKHSLNEKVGFSLRNTIKRSSSAQYVPVLIRLARAAGMTITVQLETEIARGRVLSRADYELIREQRLIQRDDMLTRLQTPVIALIQMLGGAVKLGGASPAVISASLPANNINKLAMDCRIARIDLATDRVRAEAPTNGWAIGVGSQLDQFIESENVPTPSPYDGIGVTFAVLEGTIARHHPAFRNGILSKDPSPERVLGLYVCNPACVDQKDKETTPMNKAEDSHGTSVAGIIFGDFTRNQLLTPKLNIDRRIVSGFARRAKGILFECLDVDPNSWINAMAIASAQIPKPSAVNLSAGVHGMNFDPDLCNGLDVLSKSVNDLYESGVLFIKSAGNEGTNDNDQVDEFHNTSKCLVTPPGSAIGAFTVGNHNAGVPSLVPNVRTAPVYRKSSRGGQPNNFANGRGRSIIDLTAYGSSERYLSTDPKNNAGNKDGGTSFSAPVVTASALVLTDYFRRELKSDLLDDPGALYANLLLMGDRSAGETGPSTKISSGFERNYGAGRLKMRKFDVNASEKSPSGGKGGMGIPFIHESSSAVIGAGEKLKIFLNKKVVMPKGTDVLKFVIYWYDRRHEVIGPQGRIVNLDLQLFLCGPTWLPIKPVAKSASPFDNKERIFYAPVGGISGQRLLMEISGVSGFIDDFDYGSNFPGKIRFNFAYFCESSARLGPGLDFTPNGEGVEPENLP